MQCPYAVENEGPEALHVGVGIGRTSENAVRPGQDLDLGQSAGVDQDQLGVGLANVDDEDMLGRCHGAVLPVWLRSPSYRRSGPASLIRRFPQSASVMSSSRWMI